MSITDQQRAVKKALRKTPQTALEIAERAGYDSGRAISRALSASVQAGEASVVDGRQLKYTKA
jgi:acetylglutamate kinase